MCVGHQEITYSPYFSRCCLLNPGFYLAALNAVISRFSNLKFISLTSSAGPNETLPRDPELYPQEKSCYDQDILRGNGASEAYSHTSRLFRDLFSMIRNLFQQDQERKFSLHYEFAPYRLRTQGTTHWRFVIDNFTCLTIGHSQFYDPRIKKLAQLQST